MNCATCALWYGKPVSEQVAWHASMLGGLHDFARGRDNQLALLGAIKILEATVADLKQRESET